jgi:Domain of unknown function (DUF6468)
MSNFAFFMDAGLLALLAATVFLAFRLNMNLKHFKDSRFEMEGLVNRLTTNVERAEKAIAGLQVAARNSGADMDKKIKESKFLLDELKFMNDAGNSLASRLEKIAETNRALIEKMEEVGGVGPNGSGNASRITVAEPQGMPYQTHAPHAPQNDAGAGFSIMDREFDAQANDLDDLDFEFADHGVDFQSQAERELFDALQKRKTVGGRN